MLRAVAAPAFVLGSLALVHCSSSDSPNPATSNPDGGAGTSGGGTSSGGTNPDGGSSSGHGDGDGGGDAGAEPDYEGLVAINENNTEGESAQFNIIPAVSRCSVRVTGVCTVVICPLPNPYDPASLSTPVSGGNVTITGGTAAPIVLTQGQGAVQFSAPWKIGDTLDISSAGDVVPAFSTSLVYPSNIKVTGPAPSVPLYTIPLNRATGVTFTWTSAPPVTGDIAFTIQQNRSDNNLVIECDFPRSAGTGLVPPDALTDVRPGLGQNDTAITASPNSRKVLQAGVYRINAVVTREDPYYAVFPVVQ